MRLVVSVLVLVCLAASAGSTAANLQSVNETQRQLDEYGVYNAVIGVMFADHKVTFANENNDVDLLLIESRTVSHALPYHSPSIGLDFKKLNPVPSPEPIRIVPSYGSRKFQSSEAGEREALADYSNQNNQPVTLRRLFNLKMDYALIDSQETKGEAQDGKQARGIVTFSRVGFNSARTQAVVYMGYSRYMCCGWGYGIFLVKEGATWRVDREQRIWVAIA